VCYYGAKVLETEGGHALVSHIIASLTEFIQNLFATTGLFGIVLAMAIESCCIPLPSEIIMPLAGSMLAMSMQANGRHLLGVDPGSPLWLNLFLLSLAGALGCLVGSLVAYGIGYAGGRPLMLKYGKYVLISQHDADKADKFFQRWGTATAFFSRLMPVVRTYISLPAGITKMNPVKFSIYTFLGSLPWCLLLAFIGYQLGRNYEQISGPLHYLDGVIVVVVVVLVVLYVWRHIRNDRRARAEHAAEESARQAASNAGHPWGQPSFQVQSQQPQFQGQSQPPFNSQGQGQGQAPFRQPPFSGQSVPPSAPQQSWGQPAQQWGQQPPSPLPPQSAPPQWGQQPPSPASPQWGRQPAPSQMQPPQGSNPGQGNGW
jgi:membrane protein DedA with SNARE-associated domain